MEQSDQVLLTSFRQIGFPVRQEIIKLSDFNSDDIQNICIQALRMFKVDVAPIVQLGKTQRFRVATKVNQELTKHLGTQFELNDLMNNNTDTFRKILVTLLSKISNLQQTDQKPSDEVNTLTAGDQKQKNMKVFTSWLNQEWIHPSLVNQVKVQFNSHRLKYDLNEDIQRKNILKDFTNHNLKYNIQPILNDMFNTYVAMLRKVEAEQGLVVNKRFVERYMTEVRQENQQEWKVLKSNTKKVNRLKKKLVQAQAKGEEKANPNSNQELQKGQQASVFQMQVKQLVEQDLLKQNLVNSSNIKPSSSSTLAEQNSNSETTQAKDPLAILKLDVEKVKKAHEAQINAMNEMLKKKENLIVKIEDKEAKLEQKIIQQEEKATSLKTTIVKAKKEAENKTILLNSIQVPQQLMQEVKQLRDELRQLSTQAKEEVQRMAGEIKYFEETGSQKVQILNDMKQKLTKVQTDYAKVIKDIQDKLVEKQKISIPTSGITRNFYNKRISEMEVRWKAGRQEITKTQAQLKNIQTNISVTLSTANRLETEIQNLINMDKNRNETLNKLIKEQYDMYKITFKKTLESTNTVLDSKVESREYESKVAELISKSYKQSIEKINFALEDIKQQLAQRKAQRQK